MDVSSCLSRVGSAFIAADCTGLGGGALKMIV